MLLKSLKRLRTINNIGLIISRFQGWIPNEEIGMGKSEIKELDELVKQLGEL